MPPLVVGAAQRCGQVGEVAVDRPGVEGAGGGDHSGTRQQRLVRRPDGRRRRQRQGRTVRGCNRSPATPSRASPARRPVVILDPSASCETSVLASAAIRGLTPAARSSSGAASAKDPVRSSNVSRTVASIASRPHHGQSSCSTSSTMRRAPAHVAVQGASRTVPEPLLHGGKWQPQLLGQSSSLLGHGRRRRGPRRAGVAVGTRAGARRARSSTGRTHVPISTSRSATSARSCSRPGKAVADHARVQDEREPPRVVELLGDLQRLRGELVATGFLLRVRRPRSRAWPAACSARQAMAQGSSRARARGGGSSCVSTCPMGRGSQTTGPSSEVRAATTRPESPTSAAARTASDAGLDRADCVAGVELRPDQAEQHGDSACGVGDVRVPVGVVRHPPPVQRRVGSMPVGRLGRGRHRPVHRVLGVGRPGGTSMGGEQGRVVAPGPEEQLQGARVQARSTNGAEAAVGSLPDEVVPEADHACLVAPEQARGQGGVETGVDLGECEVGQVGDARRVDDGSEHRRDQENLLPGGGEAGHPGAEDVGDGGGHDLERRGSGLRGEGDRLLQQERDCRRCVRAALAGRRRVRQRRRAPGCLLRSGRRGRAG